MFLFLGLLLTAPAVAKVKVVATLADLGWIAAQVGGEDVEVEVLCPGHRDPHVLPAKPSLARKMKKADLLIYNGLELEVGWLPLLLDAARNPRIRPGQQGELDCSLALGEGEILDVPTGDVDRSQGDIHPLGNPHYLLDPRKGMAVGHLVAARLGRLDPAAAARYAERAANLEEALTARLENWEARIAGLGVGKLIVYHQQWEYLAEWLGLDIIGVIENRPGISPAPRHVENLIIHGREQDAVLVIAATWDHIDGAGRVAEKIGTALAVLPASSGAVDEATGYPQLFEVISDRLEAAARSIEGKH
jgi:zinc/manganese transport system substrate-binding protein